MQVSDSANFELSEEHGSAFQRVSIINFDA